MADAVTIRGVWGDMSEEMAVTVLGDVKRESPDLYREALAKTAGAFRMRPEALRQQPLARQAANIRRALTQVTQQELGAHLLIEWLTKTQKPMLIHFLDKLGIPHEEGMVKEGVGPEPDPAKLRAAIEGLTAVFPSEHVRVYLLAFSVITADEWASLPGLLEESAAVASPVRSAPSPGPSPTA
jgi:hypothetical protein